MPVDNANLPRHEIIINSIYLGLIGERNSVSSRFIENGVSEFKCRVNEDRPTVLTDQVDQQLERQASAADGTPN